MNIRNIIIALIVGIVVSSAIGAVNATEVDTSGYDCDEQTQGINIVLDGHAHHEIAKPTRDIDFKFDNTPVEFDCNNYINTIQPSGHVDNDDWKDINYNVPEEIMNIQILGSSQVWPFNPGKFDVFGNADDFQVNEDEQSTWLMETINGAEEPMIIVRY